MRRYYSYRKHLKDMKSIIGNNCNKIISPVFKPLDHREVINLSEAINDFYLISGQEAITNPLYAHIDWTTTFKPKRINKEK